MREEVRSIALGAKGFLEEAEGLRLYELASTASTEAPCLEIGSYCGRSALFLGEGCRAAGRNPLFTVDHHRGSAEQQPGEAYFDPDLYDAREGAPTTLPELLRTVRAAGLEDWVLPVVASSTVLGRVWPERSLGLVFIDGGHGEEDVFGDYRAWGRCVRPGGFLCVHDVFPDSADGGQGPFRVVCEARSEGSWEDAGGVGTLAVLRRA